MNWHVVFTILILLFTSSGLIIPVVYADNQFNWVAISCFTQNKLSLSFLRLSFTALENNSIRLQGMTQFEAKGSQPILTLKIDSSGRSPLVLSGTVISDVAFFTANYSQHYYIGPYYENYSANAKTQDGIVEYRIDFTSSVEMAKNVINQSGIIDDFGIRGRMDFEIMIRNSVGIVRQKRFYSVLFQGIANLDAVICDFAIPETAYFTEAKNGNQDMQRGTPYRADTSVRVVPSEPIGANLYLEWEIAEEIPIFIRILYDPYFLLVISLILSPIATLIFEHYVWNRIRRSKRKTNKQQQKPKVSIIKFPRKTTKSFVVDSLPLLGLKF